MVPPYVPDLVLPRRDRDVGATDVGPVVRWLLRRNYRLSVNRTGGCPNVRWWRLLMFAEISDVLPDAFPVMLTSHLDLEMGPQANEAPDGVMTGWSMMSDDTDVIWNIQFLTDVCPVMLEDSATEPVSLPVVVNTETQFDVRWEFTSPSGDESGRPAGWLDIKSDCGVVDEIILDPDMSPVGSVQSVAGPTFLPTKSEVFSLAVLAGGGGGGRCCCSPPGRGKDSHSASVCPAGCWE